MANDLVGRYAILQEIVYRRKPEDQALTFDEFAGFATQDAVSGRYAKRCLSSGCSNCCEERVRGVARENGQFGSWVVDTLGTAMKKLISAILLMIFVIGGILIYPAISNPYFFVCPGGACRYDLKRVVQFYKVKLGWNRKSQLTEAERAAKATFYRFEAKYKHKDRSTGRPEIIDFDIVAVCNMRVTMSADGSVKSTHNPVPRHFMKATRDGGAVTIVVPHLCDETNLRFGDAVPADFMPFVAWLDNVNLITSQMLGYASEDAYESPWSQLSFHGAKVSQASYQDWKTWRSKQLNAFKPVGFIRSPWGISNAGGEPENKPIQFSGIMNCSGYHRIKLPGDVRVRLRPYWPASRPEFWTPFEASTTDYDVFAKILKSDAYRGGHINSGESVRRRFGVVKRNGGGFIKPNRQPRHAGEYYPKFYVHTPMIPRKVIQNIDFQKDSKGFLKCGGTGYSAEAPKSLGFAHGTGLYISGRFVSRIASPVLVFERDEYVWKQAR